MPVTLYTLTIQNGYATTSSGSHVAEYHGQANTSISITASGAGTFKRWEIVSGGGFFADNLKAETTYTFGTSATTIRAVYSGGKTKTGILGGTYTFALKKH